MSVARDGRHHASRIKVNSQVIAGMLEKVEHQQGGWRISVKRVPSRVSMQQQRCDRDK
eukprot:CAMPEP_0194777340 /NCGR_PEP_ID=MMETSP0323_2-20130528/65402_1 /TAXON_ID=2866 ORGANISM="Crypthecodinium cohnii, Strain Seligo" /NCGR_SAMPLE_ID=MMETSP0323_2 /ASSEMBLY_ACC=CAM_ASM_000346 /LENGTH=57 /DNA_ID=CAMNT_0039714107 /DNA_START=97 /DNA_END=270 /DNA_ORIENTATION=+